MSIGVTLATMLGVAVTRPAAAREAIGLDGIGTPGIYALKSGYNGAIDATHGWQVRWRVPVLVNENKTVSGAVGQWYYNLETGVYRWAGGWTVYYYGDDNGLAGNNLACPVIWRSGGWCSGFGTLKAGDEVNFKYERCDTAHNPMVGGSRICVSVDLHDGVGWRFLAEDSPGTTEMYAHDIETFSDSGKEEPIISCAQPVVMIAQLEKTVVGSWSVMSGNQWIFNDSTPRYKYQNIDTSASPSTWQACVE